jgi:superfamily I DNA/RNA helicase
MHQAKGLTAETVFIAGAEDEYIPGDQTGNQESDARRLLYVSLTRAKHSLFITYCRKRTGPQQFTGSTGPSPVRTLTRFLRDSPIKPIEGLTFIQSIAK